MAIAELAVDGGQAEACAACGAGGVYRLETTDRHCAQCGSVSLYRRCLRCKKILIIGPNLVNVPRWKCLGCGKEAASYRWPPVAMGELTAAKQDYVDLYREMGVPLHDALSDPDRRKVDGALLQADGISGIATGGVTVFFDREVATLMIGTMANRRSIRYSDLSILQFAGRGAFTTQSGGGWVGGGFGLQGAFEGALLAGVMNKLSTVTRTHIETIVTLGWETGTVVLLNSLYAPEQMASFLQPVVRRIEAANVARGKPTVALAKPSTPDLAEKLQQLASLHASGALTDAEFSAAKARLLG